MSAEQTTWPVTVQTAPGSLRGAADRHDTVAWRGVPFAQPPVGDLRWKAPRPPQPWEGTRDALAFAPAPWQAGTEGTSEDCLYLNVWRPDHAREGLPVYVWLPGGGNRLQVPALSATPGALLASRSDVVVVTVSYRLAELGWFTHPALRDGSEPLDASGNFGTLDVIAALRWIRENIHGFGGDPGNVLVTGESAGAYNTLTMLISPEAHGLFHKAMAESGRQDTHPVEEADERGETLLRRLLEAEHGADAAARARSEMPAEEIAAFLRGRTPEQIATAARGLPFFAGYRDGRVIHHRGFASLDDGTYPNKVPAIIGMNQEESKFQLSRNRELSEDRELYEGIARAGSLMKRATGCDDILRRLRANTDQPPVYGYLFLWGWDGADHPNPLPEPLSWRLGAAHGTEIPFFLHGGERPVMGGRAFTDANRPGRIALAEAMMGYLRNFAHAGEPGSPDPAVPVWEPWSNEAGGPKHILLDADPDRALIRMSSEELTPADARSRIEEMPSTVRDTARRTVRGLA